MYIYISLSRLYFHNIVIHAFSYIPINAHRFIFFYINLKPGLYLKYKPEIRFIFEIVGAFKTTISTKPLVFLHFKDNERHFLLGELSSL